jgi:hypothetical protein
MIDVIKFLILAGLYLVAGPLAGVWLAHKRAAQRGTLAALVFMTSWHINKLTLMVGSVELYRGHTKGFEGSLLEVVAIALLVARWREKSADFRWVPGWAWLWLLHCGAATLSVLAAPNPTYAWMAAWKFTSAVVILAAGWNTVRDDEDMRWLGRGVAATLIVQACVVMKMRYVDGFYQVRGWFEHQNPLAMWAYMLGLPLFALAMAPVSAKDTRWYGAGFLAAGLVVYGSLSRAALAVFAVGTVGVAGWSLVLDKFTAKRVRVIGVMAGLGMLGLPLVLDTVVARFNDEGNQASGETRDVMNLAARAMVRDSFIGIGWNNFALTINAPFTYGDVINDWERDRGHKVDEDYAKGVVESHYWLLLAENGWPGYLTYMFFIVLAQGAILAGWWRHRASARGAYLLGLAVALTLLYAHSNLERVLTQTKNLAAYFVLLGAALRLARPRAAGDEPKTGA